MGVAVPTIRNPAECLEGQVLGNRWTVIKRRNPGPHSTGSTFSVGYEAVDHSGRRGFVKALDLLGAMNKLGSNTTEMLRWLLDTHEYERAVLHRCEGATRVVVAVDEGEYRDPSVPQIPVPYLVFDLAEGDIRSQRVNAEFDSAYRLRTLHHATVGLSQLHTRRIAHQDVKPSNLMVFANSGTKVGDLGRAIDGINGSPFDSLAVAGQTDYAPPELRYDGHQPGTWEEHRLGCDVYQLGSILVFMYLDMHMNTLLKSHLHPSHYRENWTGTYTDVLPYLVSGFQRSLETFRSAVDRDHGNELASRLTLLLEYLCHPDPGLRGHPSNRRGHQNPYGLERFVTAFDVLATAAEHGIVDALRSA